MRAYIERTKRPQINDIMLHLKLLENQEQANRQKREIIKIKAVINEIEAQKNHTKNQ
jgi:hypothetical protein